MEERHPASFFREAVRQLCARYEAPQNRDAESQYEAFRVFLEQSYQTAIQRYEQSIANNDTEGRIRANQLGRFMLAVGLLTYGRVDVVEDILDNMPLPEATIGRLAWVLKGLMPMPEDLDPLKDIEAVRKWVLENKSRLKWDERSEKYVFAAQQSQKVRADSYCP
jgi:hypothetical protein